MPKQLQPAIPQGVFGTRPQPNRVPWPDKRWRKKEREHKNYIFKSLKIPLGLCITSCAVCVERGSLKNEGQARMLLITDQASVPHSPVPPLHIPRWGTKNRCLETCGLLGTRKRSRRTRTQRAQKAAPQKAPSQVGTTQQH